MDAEQEASAGGDPDGPRVVGGAQPEQDGSVPRRDRPAPAPWTREVPPDDVPEDYVAKPVPRRAMSIPRLVVVTLLMVILADMFVGFVVTAVRGETVPVDMALRLIYGAVIQFVGWWTVIHLVRHR
jgi:hypothetical protein